MIYAVNLEEDFSIPLEYDDMISRPEIISSNSSDTALTLIHILIELNQTIADSIGSISLKLN